MSEATPRADRLFQTAHDGEAYALAQQIERRENISLDDLTPFLEVLDRRYGDDITLLFHAIASANLSAVDALLAAGADTRQADKSTGSTRDFVFYLASPGGPLLDEDGINQMIRSYLAHGGDANARLRNDQRRPLIAALAVIDNTAGMDILLAAGADPWAFVDESASLTPANAMTYLASGGKQYDYLNRLIDAGHFDNRTQKEIAEFLSALGGYSQRGDERSLAIKSIAMRVLKRLPNYVEPSDVNGTVRIFKDHYNDPDPGVIPWELIRSDDVQ